MAFYITSNIHIPPFHPIKDVWIGQKWRIWNDVRRLHIFATTEQPQESIYDGCQNLSLNTKFGGYLPFNTRSTIISPEKQPPQYNAH